MINNNVLGFFKNVATEENCPSVDVLSCLGGFSLVLGPAGEVVFVSNNIHTYLGLASVSDKLLVQEGAI